jgi:putative endonuclease
MKGTVYILKDEEGKFYVGSTNDLERRMRQHQLRYTQTTRNMRAPKLVLAQEYSSLSAARKVERRIKNLKRKDYIESMVSAGCIRIKA